MDYKKVTKTLEGVLLQGVKHFNLKETLDNGQAFRWQEVKENHFSGVAFNQFVELIQEDETILIKHITLDDFHNHWQDYLDLNTSYEEIKALFSADPILSKAVAFAPGLRLLRQDPWETMISFIFSQNNNIKRIKGLVQHFSQEFGQPIPMGHAFPTPQTVVALSLEDLSPVRAGFRGKYVVSAAQEVTSGNVSLELPYTLPLDEARVHLQQVKGIGPKVADCILLFAFHRIEAFPKDVWIIRALEHFYPKGFPVAFQPYAGIAQQYLFNYARLNPELFPKAEK